MKFLFQLLLTTLMINLLAVQAHAQFFRTDKRTKPSVKVHKGSPLPSADTLLKQGFDTGQFPPAGWDTLTTNSAKTWESLQLPETPFYVIDSTSQASAVCRWSLNQQDEWLISPLLNAQSYQSLYVSFYGGFSKTYLDYANFRLLGRHKDSTNWKPIWNAHQDTLTYSGWQWRYQEIPVFKYTGKQFQLAWQYVGSKGDLTALDAVRVLAGGPARGTNILSFSFPGQTEPATIDTGKHTVQVLVENGAQLTSITPEMELSPGATAQPPVGEPQDFSLNQAFVYTIYPADSTVAPQPWKIYITMENVSAAARILDLTLPSQTKEAEIDTTNHTVTVEVAYGTNLDSLAPEINISAGADIEPASGTVQSFESGEPVIYTVYPQDPDAEPVEWEVYVTLQDYLNDITAFSLPEQTHPAEIDSPDHQVFVEVASDVSLDNLTPSLSVSPGATVSPDSGQTISVTPDEPVLYTVTAANGDEQVWEVYIYKQITTILLQNFDNSSHLPEGWYIEATNKAYTWRIQKLPDIPFDSINPYSHYSAVCPWSTMASNEKLVSPVTALPADQSPGLVFYAGFSRTWLDSATLSVQARNPETSETQELWNASSDTSAGNQWRWRMVWIDLENLAGTKQEFIWKYKGRLGDLAALDDIYIAEKTALQREFLNPELKVQKQKTKSISVYPNPVRNRIYFSKAVDAYRLYSLHGKLLKQKQRPGIRRINAGNLTQGIYILKFTRNGQHLTQKIVKQ